MSAATCIIPNCGKRAPVDQPFCADHRHDQRPYAYCCNGDPKHCDCAHPDHGTALFPRSRTQPPLPEASGDVGLRKAQIKTVAEKFAAFTGAPYEDWRHFTIEAGHILDRLEALSRPEAGGKEAAGEGEGRISAVREKLRLRMLEQPISEERNTYSDGYAGGLMDAIGMLDEALQSLPARPGVTREDIAKLRENIPMPGSYDQMRGTYAQGYAQCLDAIMALIQGEAS